MGKLVRTKFDRPDAYYGRYYFGGGGGGGGDGVKYDSLEKLYAEQAASARLLRNIAETNLPGATQAYVGEVQNVLAPDFANRRANLAGADMASANAMERAATERNLASMGVNPNDPRFAGSMRGTQLSNAARMAAGKNLTRNEADQYQLNVAKDAVGTFTGQSNSAATQMGNAASGLGSVYANQQNQQMAQQQAQSQAVGNAVAGGLAAWSMFKDGGKVKGCGLKGIRRHADGGSVGESYDEYASAMQTGVAMKNAGITPQQWEGAAQKAGADTAATKSPDSHRWAFGIRNTLAMKELAEKGWRPPGYSDGAASMTIEGAKDGGKIKKIERHMLGGTAGSQQGNQGFFQMQQIAPPPVAQAPQQQGSIVNPATMAAMKKIADNNPEIGVGIDRAGSAIAEKAADVYTSIVGPQSQSGAGVEVVDAAIKPVSEVAAAAPAASEAVSAAAMTGLQDAGLATAAGTVAEGAGAGAAIAAEGAAAGSLMGAVGAALPWVGAAYAVGSLLDWWNEGGQVGTQNKGMSEAEAMRRFSDAFNAGEVNDLRAGGDVPGEWRENVDTVPALLVEGEGVLNAEAMALGGEKVMEDLNAKGLALREQGITPHDIKRGIGLRGLKKRSAA